MTTTHPRRRGAALVITGLLTAGLMTSLAPQWAHADPPASPPHKAPTTTINDLSIPEVAAAHRQSAQQKSTQQKSSKQAAPQTRQAGPRTNASTPSATASTPSANPSAQGGTTAGADRIIADLPARSTKQFSMLGVTWLPGSTDQHANVQVRTRPVKGSWTDWSTLDNEADTAPKGTKRIGTAPTYVGESDAVQVKVTGTSATHLKDLKVTLINSPVVASDLHPQLTTAQPMSATASSQTGLYPQPAIISRRGWGADESLRSTCSDYYDSTIDAVVVHHTAGTNNYSRSQAPSIVRGIYAYHTQTHGWCDIGYNFLIDRYGDIFEGRRGGIDLPVHGAHATLWNTNTSGISLMGNFQVARPPSVMISSLEKLAAWKLQAYYRDPRSRVTLAGKTEYRIFGHGDVMQTACPGQYVHAMLPEIRANVAAMMGSYRTANYLKWQSQGGESGWMGSPYMGERPLPGGGRFTRFSRADIYWHSRTGAHYVKGLIRNYYNAHRAYDGMLGYPITDEVAGKASGDRVSHFQRGGVYWSSRTGTHAVHGEIGKKYRSLGEDGSRMRMPVTDEEPGPIRGSIIQQFSGAASMLYTYHTGAWPIWGRIRQKYLGYDAYTLVRLGLPTGMEEPSPVRGVTQTYSSGVMYWTGTNAYAVYGRIGSTYRAMGGETSRLGMPTSDEFNVSGGRANTFEHGKITWVRSQNKTYVTYN